MTRRELMAWIFGCVMVVTIVSTIGYFYVESHKIDAEINAQKEVKRIEIEEKEATIRTKERMQWIPWYDNE